MHTVKTIYGHLILILRGYKHSLLSMYREHFLTHKLNAYCKGCYFTKIKSAKPRNNLSLKCTHLIISPEQIFPDNESILVLLWPVLDHLVDPIVPVPLLGGVL